ncbi:MAG: IPT/TIG domain-containing protein [Pyrinomonadaceae bacterium]
MKKRLAIFAICLVSLAAVARGQRQTIFVSPQSTDSEISTHLNNHVVSINNSVTPKNKLFVFFPGTGGVAFNYLELNRTAADLGLHAINMTYPNTDAVNEVCGGLNSDLECYRNVRLEILDGTDRTTLVNVNRPNSIENRLVKLLILLRTNRPSEKWNQFLLDDQTVDWSKVVVAGHSQGGGHAGIIARYHLVARSLMFAAMDFNGRSLAPATWISNPETTPNATPASRFWAFSHTSDESVNFSLLSSVIWPLYGMDDFGEITNVDSVSPPYSNTHSLTTNLPNDNAHGCIAADARLAYENGVPIYKPVWEYMLSGLDSEHLISRVGFLNAAGSEVARPFVGSPTKRYRLRITGAGFQNTSTAEVNGKPVTVTHVSETELITTIPAGTIRPAGRSAITVNTDGNLAETTF